VTTQDNTVPLQLPLPFPPPLPLPLPKQQGFSTGDVLWALGIWSVMLSLSPVIAFYMLMVA
jgi:hypothetical protein